MVLIAKLSPPHISSPVCACIQSDGRRGQCPSGRIGRSSVGKMTKLQLFSVITQMCWWPDGSLELRSIQPSGLPPNPVTPGIRRSQRWGRRSHSKLTVTLLSHHPSTPPSPLASPSPLLNLRLLLSLAPPPCLTGPSVTPL